MSEFDMVRAGLDWFYTHGSDPLAVRPGWLRGRRPWEALDSIEGENLLLKEDIRVREESQIPVIPRGVVKRFTAIETENERLREALLALSEHGTRQRIDQGQGIGAFARSALARRSSRLLGR